MEAAQTRPHIIEETDYSSRQTNDTLKDKLNSNKTESTAIAFRAQGKDNTKTNLKTNSIGTQLDQ